MLQVIRAPLLWAALGTSKATPKMQATGTRVLDLSYLSRQGLLMAQPIVLWSVERIRHHWNL